MHFDGHYTKGEILILIVCIDHSLTWMLAATKNRRIGTYLSQISVFLWVIRRNPWETTSTPVKREFVTENSVFLEKDFLSQKDSRSKVQLKEI
jgi:hypothetical protein